LAILVDFKQLHSNLNNKQPIYLKLHTFKNICANSNSLDHIWVNCKSFVQTWVQLEPSGQIGRVSFRFAYIIGLSICENYNSPNQHWTNWNNVIQIWV